MDSQILMQQGFEGFVTIDKLKSDPYQIPTKQGVYVVLLPQDSKPAFLENGTGGFFKDKNPNVPISELKANWVNNTDIIYIGKAGGSSSRATLQSRLIQYLKFGMGIKIGHWGGRYIWQLANSDNLLICWKPTKQDARDVERENDNMDDVKYTKKVTAFNDDDIPYEVRMKHIIEAYRKDLKRLEALEKYAKGLEEENLLLQKKMEKTDAWLAEEPDRQAAIQKMQLEIKQLRGTLIKSIPKRVIQMRDIKKKVMSLEEYIRYLQRLLQQNDIPYDERKVNPSKSESIDFDSLDIFAVRGPKENYDSDDDFVSILKSAIEKEDHE